MSTETLLWPVGVKLRVDPSLRIEDEHKFRLYMAAIVAEQMSCELASPGKSMVMELEPQDFQVDISITRQHRAGAFLSVEVAAHEISDRTKDIDKRLGRIANSLRGYFQLSGGHKVKVEFIPIEEPIWGVG